MRIYLDNAATTKMSKTAISAMLPYFDNVYGNPSSLHSDGLAAAAAVSDARARMAKQFGCSPNEIIFTSGGSESDVQALSSASLNGAKNGKKHIISTNIEHHAVLHTLEGLKKNGFELTLLSVQENGMISPEQLKSAIRKDTCLVSVMYANNEIGTLQPISELGAICRDAKIPFHTDAVQAAGHIRIDVKRENIDMLSLSAHKFHGPKGIGALYVRNGIAVTPLIKGGAQERGKRAGTENVPAIAGMAAALDEAYEHLDEKNSRISELRDKLIRGLSEIPHSILNGDAKHRLSGNVNFCFEGIEGESLLLLLDDKGVSASSGSACTSGSLDPSHVLLAIGRPHDIAHGSLRLTLSEENTDEEIEYTVKAVKDTVAYLRNMSPVWRDLIEGKRRFITK